MPAVTEAPPTIEEVIEEDFSLDTGEAPPIFGRCPVCGKPLLPRDRLTGQPKAPPAGTGYQSRAKCSGCGTIICYLGNGKWRPLFDSDLSEDDLQADKFDSMFQ